MPKRLAVIGAGASGITAIKQCVDSGLLPVCFERTGEIGGLWHYTTEAREGQACVMKSTVINTSKEMVCYSDFPPPAEFPNYMHNTKLLEYFHMYIKHFDLEKYIRFHTEILQISKAENFETTGQWVLKVKDKKDESKNVVTEMYDGILLCTGQYAQKRFPNLAGAEMFKGKIIHSIDYKDHVGYEDKRVVVIGVGNSGGDVAVDLSRIASQVYLSTRRGTWILNRMDDNGMPTDLLRTRRVFRSINSILGPKIANDNVERRLNRRCDHRLYGLKPKHRFGAQQPTINDDLPSRICCGSIIVKPDIRHLTSNGLEFVDGTIVEDMDVVICATGYEIGFPALDKEVIEVKENVVPLYKFVFPPDLKPCTLAVIGCIQGGAIIPINELQCRWAVQLFKGTANLPSCEAMWQDIRKTQKSMSQRYVASTRHTVQVDWIPYMDELAEQIDAKPKLMQLFWSDPRLALQMYFGPCTPYQYRVVGPNNWPGARKAIMTIWERVYKPFETGKVKETNQKTEGLNYLKLMGVLVFIAVFLRYWFMFGIFWH